MEVTRIAAIVASLVWAVSAIGFAQEKQDRLYEVGDWRKMTTPEKRSFILGYSYGISLEGNRDPNKPSASEWNAEACARYIDVIYDAEDNANLLLHQAISVAALMRTRDLLIGEDAKAEYSKKIERVLEESRREALEWRSAVAEAKRKREQEAPFLPKSLADAHQKLEEILPPEVLAAIDALESKEEMFKFHFSVGLFIRNAWGLAAVGPIELEEIGVGDADGRSALILETFWCKRHGQPFELQERSKVDRGSREVGGHERETVKAQK